MSKICVSIDPDPTFETTVKVPGPGGKALEFVGTFKHRDQEELEQFVTGDGASSRSEVDSVMGVLVGWKGLDEPFGRPAVEKLCKKWHAAGGVITALYVWELKQARLGN